MGWAGRRTYNALITCALGTVVCTISNSTTCQQCNPGHGESPARCTYVPLLAVRVRVFGSHLDRFVARDELYKTYMVHSHAVDGRRLQVVAGASVRKTEAFSQNRPTQGCATSGADPVPGPDEGRPPRAEVYSGNKAELAGALFECQEGVLRAHRLKDWFLRQGLLL